MAAQLDTVIMRPAWDDLEKLIAAAKSHVLIVSPFISKYGVDRISTWLLDNKVCSVEIKTRLSPVDWAAGISDPESLLVLLEYLQQQSQAKDFAIIQRLHAKLYVADDAQAIVGSANLSEGGFGGNLELAVQLGDVLTKQALALLKKDFAPAEKRFSVAELGAWVANSKGIIQTARQGADDVAEKVAEAQRALDTALLAKNTPLGAASGTPKLPGIDLSQFTTWLKKNLTLAGALTVLDRRQNALTSSGHVIQGANAIADFLKINNTQVDVLSGELSKLKVDDIYQPSDAVIKSWIDHFEKYATMKLQTHDYASLRGRLPPSVGGTLAGGGGGIGTFKRLFPLVARYLKEGGT